MSRPRLEPMGRHDVARRVGVHQDTVTARLRDGLGSAVVKWGGRGQLMTFSRFHVDRWAAAFKCRRQNGQRCSGCAFVLEDCEHVAAHLIEARHGVNGCELCTAPWITTIPHEEATQ